MNESSVHFTKQLALSFVALVLLLFMSFSGNQHVLYPASSGEVNGVSTQSPGTTMHLETTKQRVYPSGRPIPSNLELSCQMCLAGGQKYLCLERNAKVSKCVNGLPSTTTGTVTCVVCGGTPPVEITRRPYPSGYPLPTTSHTTPWPTKVVPTKYPTPQPGCHYEYNGCKQGQNCTPEYHIVCGPTGTPMPVTGQ